MSGAAVQASGVPQEIKLPPGRQIVLPREGEKVCFADLIGMPAADSDFVAWTNAEQTRYVGGPLPPAPIVVARVVVPEGYRIMRWDEEITGRTKIFNAGTGEWDALQEHAVGRTVESINGGNRSLSALLFAEPIDPMQAIPDWPIPARHRELGRNETILRRDQFACVSHGKWRQVPEEARQMSVEAFQDWLHAETVRVIRPIHPDFRNWYVDLRPEHGAMNATGSATDPFDSLASATSAIDAAAKKAGKNVYGMIWDVRGVPLMAYDLETADQPFPSEENLLGMLPRRGPYAGTHGPIHPMSPEDLDGVVGIDPEHPTSQEEAEDILRREMARRQLEIGVGKPLSEITEEDIRKALPPSPHPSMTVLLNSMGIPPEKHMEYLTPKEPLEPPKPFTMATLDKIETLEERTEAAIEALQDVLKQLRQWRKEAKR